MARVWRVVAPDEHCYVPRCTCCGRFKGTLRMHWFFTGLYCVDCIEENLYGGYRSVKEM